MKLRASPLSRNRAHNAPEAPRVLGTRERQASPPRRCALCRGAAATIARGLLNTSSAAGQAAPAKQLMSEQAFKNVTVLKGIPVDEFMDTMGFISASTNNNFF